MSQKVYSSYQALLAGERWQVLEAAGTRPQRVLWASTSVKDSALPDTHYVGSLAVPDTIDTMPEETLVAFADHGTLEGVLEPNYGAAERVIAAIAGEG